MYDIFISFKHTDEQERPTEDFAIARSLFERLKDEGYSVFFSQSSLKELGSSRYKRDIDAALDSAKVMIVVLTRAEYAVSDWVQYEWDSFFNDTLSGVKPDGKVYTLTKDVNITSLPRTLRNVQNFVWSDDCAEQILEYIAPVVSRNDLVPAPQPSEGRFKIIKGKDITAEDIQKALDLESLVYHEETMQSLSSCLKYFDVNPDIYMFVKDVETGNIVANVDIAPVTEDCYEKLRSGHFVDKDITTDMVLSYDLPCIYDLYFSSIVIHRDYRGTDLFLKLFNEIVKQFISLGSREVYARRMLADAVTEEGEKFCKLFGMHKVKDSDHSSTLYEISLIPPRFRIISKATKVLYDYYQKKYEEEPYLFE